VVNEGVCLYQEQREHEAHDVITVLAVSSFVPARIDRLARNDVVDIDDT
jgi:hypothetical protein